MTTTSRLLNLLSLLQTRRDWPGSLLAERLDISDRTVRRDIDRLRELGYSIHTTMGVDGGYRLDAGSELPPLLFDDDQALALAVALQAAPGIGVGIEEAAIRALATIRQVMPVRLRHRLDALHITTVGRPGDAPLKPISFDVLVAVSNAIRDHATLRFDYLARNAADADADAGSGEGRELHPPRRVEPHHLVTSHGRWYLVGWDLDRDDWRIYNVDRVRPRTPNGPQFTPRTVPGGNVDEFVSGRFKGSEVNEWPCRGTVILHLPASRVVPFAGDGTVTALDEHRCALEAGSWSWGSLAASFGHFDVTMEVLSPPELAEAFATLSERYAATSHRWQEQHV